MFWLVVWLSGPLYSCGSLSRLSLCHFLFSAVFNSKITHNPSIQQPNRRQIYLSDKLVNINRLRVKRSVQDVINALIDRSSNRDGMSLLFTLLLSGQKQGMQLVIHNVSYYFFLF